MKHESRPFLIILDKDFEVASKMLTEKDLSRQIVNSYKLLLRVYFKRYGLTNLNVWKHILETHDEILDKAFPNWPTKKYPVQPPKCKIVEFRYIKLCLNNFNYVLQYALSLCTEYTRRFHKKHVKHDVFIWISNNLPPLQYSPTYVTEYPILSIPIKYRKTDYITSAQILYKSMIENPLEEYNKVDVPDFFNIKQY
jgi:hypothetical protein